MVSSPGLAAPKDAKRLTYVAEAGFPSLLHTMFIDKPGRNGGNGDQNWGLIVTNGGDNEFGPPPLGTLAHEVGHFLGLWHRDTPATMGIGGQVVNFGGRDDGIKQPKNLNLMDVDVDWQGNDLVALGPPSPLVDFDLPQVYAALGLPGEQGT